MNRNAKAIQTKSRKHEVAELATGIYDVTSGTSGETYRVIDHYNGTFACSCKWAEYHRAGECSHTVAVREFIAENQGRKISAWASEEQARKQHRAIAGQNEGLTFTSRKA